MRIFRGVVNTDNDSRHFQRQIAVTKPKAINVSTQSTEKHHKEKNVLNIHQVSLLAQFSLGPKELLNYVFVRTSISWLPAKEAISERRGGILQATVTTYF